MAQFFIGFCLTLMCTFCLVYFFRLSLVFFITMKIVLMGFWKSSKNFTSMYPFLVKVRRKGMLIKE